MGRGTAKSGRGNESRFWSVVVLVLLIIPAQAMEGLEFTDSDGKLVPMYVYLVEYYEPNLPYNIYAA